MNTKPVSEEQFVKLNFLNLFNITGYFIQENARPADIDILRAMTHFFLELYLSYRLFVQQYPLCLSVSFVYFLDC